ncbi:hypothetical protein BDZ85DRAFT_98453 [Elsinoe ampelina]|uniref:Uncharacterized protein n=1 Tax=Elsinoe ampelina TaxID=302913 RepID=A0A6A6GF81_9PEZI|nr:hypothetical protein BDZ85DRAFT_98453 [Elsinoe ampelina]
MMTWPLFKQSFECLTFIIIISAQYANTICSIFLQSSRPSSPSPGKQFRPLLDPQTSSGSAPSLPTIQSPTSHKVQCGVNRDPFSKRQPRPLCSRRH